MTIASASIDQRASVTRLERRERAAQIGLAGPALLLIALLVFVPVAWLGVMSFLTEGKFTFEHYERLFVDAAYARSILLTLKISVIVTGLCVLLGYPVSYLLSQARSGWAIVGLTLVMIPFWTSLLVRTYAWLVLLQRQGLINRTLIDLGIIREPLYLAHNETGTMIGMLHIMLPFLILPLYANMRRIDMGLVRAAASLGATPRYAFWRVYFPMSVPGLVAGAVLVFVLCLGFYITPAVLGGGKTLMIAMMIERSVNLFFEWGAASALAISFVIVVMVLFYLLNKLLPVERLLGGH
ncbi:MAG: ABC transporter permease [Alphaproteobacteria bacterium]